MSVAARCSQTIGRGRCMRRHAGLRMHAGACGRADDALGFGDACGYGIHAVTEGVRVRRSMHASVGVDGNIRRYRYTRGSRADGFSAYTLKKHAVLEDARGRRRAGEVGYSTCGAGRGEAIEPRSAWLVPILYRSGTEHRARQHACMAGVSLQWTVQVDATPAG